MSTEHRIGKTTPRLNKLTPLSEQMTKLAEAHLLGKLCEGRGMGFKRFIDGDKFITAEFRRGDKMCMVVLRKKRMEKLRPSQLSLAVAEAIQKADKELSA